MRAGARPAAARPQISRPARGWWLAAVSLQLVWLGVFCASGIAWRGYQLTDDHTILSIHAALEHDGVPLPEVLADYVATDLSIRFRPVYYFVHVLRTACFALNFSAWTLSQIALCLAASALLFASLALLRFPPLLCFLAPLLALLGPQACIWYTFGPQEPFGVLFAALALLAVSLACRDPRRQQIWRASFVLAAIAMSLSKESFILALPGLTVWRIWVMRAHGGHTWPAVLRREALLAVLLLALAAAEILLTTTCVGTAISYVGVRSHSGLPLRVLWTLVDHAPRSELLLLVLMLGTFVICRLDRDRGLTWQKLREHLRAAAGVIVAARRIAEPLPDHQAPRWPWGSDDGASRMGGTPMFSSLAAIALVLTWVVPQYVLYSQTGIGGRYRLPAALGGTLALLVAFPAARSTFSHFRPLFQAAILAYAAYLGLHTWRMVKQDAANTKATAAFLEAARDSLRATDRLNDAKGVLVIAGDPGFDYEWILSTLRYLTIRGGIPAHRIYFWPLLAERYPPNERALAESQAHLAWFEGRTFDPGATGHRSPRAAPVAWEDVYAVAVLPGCESAMLRESEGRCRAGFVRRAFAWHGDRRRPEFVLYAGG